MTTSVVIFTIYAVNQTSSQHDSTAPELSNPSDLGRNLLLIHPGRLTWNIIMEVWKIIFLSKWVICMFHVNLPGCRENPRKSLESLDGFIRFCPLQPCLSPVNGSWPWFRTMDQNNGKILWMEEIRRSPPGCKKP